MFQFLDISVWFHQLESNRHSQLRVQVFDFGYYSRGNQRICVWARPLGRFIINSLI